MDVGALTQTRFFLGEGGVTKEGDTMYIYCLQTQCIGKHYRLHMCDDHKHHNIDDFTKPTINHIVFTLRSHTLWPMPTHVGLQEGRYLKVADNAKYT